SVGMVSDFAVPQCGQVMTDSRIMALPKTCSGYRSFGRISIASSVVQAFAIKAEGDQRETQDERRDQHIIGPGEPGGEPDRAKHDYKQRRNTTYRCKDGTDRTGRDEGAVAHGRQLFGAEGYPASVVARVSAATSALVSS